MTGSLVGIAGAIGGGLLTLGSTVFTKTLDTGEEVTKTVGDVFDDIGDFLDTGGSGDDDGTNQLDFNSFIQKEGDRILGGENFFMGKTGGENFFLGSCRVTDERRDFPTGNDGHLAKGPRTFGF